MSSTSRSRRVAVGRGQLLAMIAVRVTKTTPPIDMPLFELDDPEALVDAFAAKHDLPEKRRKKLVSIVMKRHAMCIAQLQEQEAARRRRTRPQVSARTRPSTANHRGKARGNGKGARRGKKGASSGSAAGAGAGAGGGSGGRGVGAGGDEAPASSGSEDVDEGSDGDEGPSGKAARYQQLRKAAQKRTQRNHRRLPYARPTATSKARRRANVATKRRKGGRTAKKKPTRGKSAVARKAPVAATPPPAHRGGEANSDALVAPPPVPGTQRQADGEVEEDGMWSMSSGSGDGDGAGAGASGASDDLLGDDGDEWAAAPSSSIAAAQSSGGGGPSVARRQSAHAMDSVSLSEGWSGSDSDDASDFSSGEPTSRRRRTQRRAGNRGRRTTTGSMPSKRQQAGSRNKRGGRRRRKSGSRRATVFDKLYAGYALRQARHEQKVREKLEAEAAEFGISVAELLKGKPVEPGAEERALARYGQNNEGPAPSRRPLDSPLKRAASFRPRGGGARVLDAGTRLYTTGVEQKRLLAEMAERQRERQARREPWTCPACAHVNVGTDKTCQRVTRWGPPPKGNPRGPRDPLKRCGCAKPRLFEVQVLPTSRSMVGNREKNHVQKVSQEITAKRNERHASAQQAPPPGLEECTFKPKITEASRDYALRHRGKEAERLREQQRLLKAREAEMKAKRARAKRRASAAGSSARDDSGVDNGDGVAHSTDEDAASGRAVERGAAEHDIATREAAEREALPADGSGVDDDVDDDDDDDDDGDGDNFADNPYQRLYLDAKSRQQKRKKMDAAPPEYSFAPNIAQYSGARFRRDGGLDGFITRLHKSGEATAKKVERMRRASRPKFKPSITRGPTTQRNAANEPIHDYLYAGRFDAADMRKLAQQRAEDQRRAAHATKYSSAKSKQLLARLEFKAYAYIFNALQATTPAGVAELEGGDRSDQDTGGRDTGRDDSGGDGDRSGGDRRSGSGSGDDAGTRRRRGAARGGVDGGASVASRRSTASVTSMLIAGNHSSAFLANVEPRGELNCAEATTELLDARLAGVVEPVLAANADATMTFRDFVVVMAPIVQHLGGGARLLGSARRDAYFRSLAAREAAADECTFQPSLNPTSVAMVRGRGTTPAEERLQIAGKEYEERRQRAARQAADAAMEECTFQPAVNPNTAALSQEYYASLEAEEPADVPTPTSAASSPRPGRRPARQSGAASRLATRPTPATTSHDVDRSGVALQPDPATYQQQQRRLKQRQQDHDRQAAAVTLDDEAPTPRTDNPMPSPPALSPHAAAAAAPTLPSAPPLPPPTRGPRAAALAADEAGAAATPAAGSPSLDDHLEDLEAIMDAVDREFAAEQPTGTDSPAAAAESTPRGDSSAVASLERASGPGSFVDDDSQFFTPQAYPDTGAAAASQRRQRDVPVVASPSQRGRADTSSPVQGW